ncbi:MAG: SOS response-associated peptidase family protein [Lachnospiraceae bacterium]|nr:SOS response-associated peptidase family protein [Lachnospiraceae bacterium]
MCTRYALEKDLPELKEIADAALRSALAQRFIDTHARPIITHGEVRPTDIVPVIAPNARGRRTVFPMQWGFLAKDNKRTLFNARVETAGEKPTFREAWQSHRCIIPASYYLEWQHFKSPDGREKTGDRFVIQPVGCTLTWLCGLYRMEGNYPAFVVLTKKPTVELSKIHDRMPLMLPADKIEDWINPSSIPEEVLAHAISGVIIEKDDNN